ncbi:MAG: butyrate kinase [Spirochaetaceae bacterium]|nr:MAG: butyrate kinase [Spirochaetaceae bacterium]
MMVLVINPGSTSTKLALYAGTSELFNVRITHDTAELARFPNILDQLDFRKQLVLAVLDSRAEFHAESLSAVIGRGGLLHPLPGGVYRVNAAMKRDLRTARYGAHASNLGALLADLLAGEYGVEAFIADPVVVDEMSALARYTGLREISRKSIFHALNQKATAKKAAARLGLPYGECNLIVAHLGGGTSVAIHQGGRVTDVNNALDGDGPFSVERAGQLPAGDWLRYILAHSENPQYLQKRLTGRGGIVSHLGSNDMKLIEQIITAHLEDRQFSTNLDGAKCLEVVQAMCYQVAKEICSLAAVVNGRIHAVVLTGGLASDVRIVREIRDRVSFLGPFFVFPGENEMEALAIAAQGALEGREIIREYSDYDAGTPNP